MSGQIGPIEVAIRSLDQPGFRVRASRAMTGYAECVHKREVGAVRLNFENGARTWSTRSIRAVKIAVAGRQQPATRQIAVVACAKAVEQSVSPTRRDPEND